MLSATTSWPGPLVWYGYLAGVAAGAAVANALTTLLGGEEDRTIARSAPILVIVLLAVCCGLIAVEPRAWIRLGAVARASLVSLSATSVAAALGNAATARWSHSAGGQFVALPGAIAAVGLAVTAGPWPSRSEPEWVGPLVLGVVALASAVATGTAAVILLACCRRSEPDHDAAVGRLTAFLTAAIVVELAALTALALSLRGLSGLAFQRAPGRLIPLFVIPIGLVAPLVCQLRRDRRGALDAAWLVLLGGFVLRVAVAGIPASLTLR